MTDLDLAAIADQVAASLTQRIDGPPLTEGMRLTAREAVLRHQTMTFGMMAFAATYTPTMDEPALRAWAAGVASAIKGT